MKFVAFLYSLFVQPVVHWYGPGCIGTVASRFVHRILGRTPIPLRSVRYLGDVSADRVLQVVLLHRVIQRGSDLHTEAPVIHSAVGLEVDHERERAS